MTNLPVNLLLYLVSLGLAGGSGYVLYEAYLDKARSREKLRKAVPEQFQKSLETGSGREADDVRDHYGRNQAWWTAFKEANFIGKPPPKPPDPRKVEEQEQKTPIEEGIDLDDILEVICIVYGGDDTSVWIRYAPEANVRPPEDAVAAAGPPGFAGPGDRAGTAPAPAPTRSGAPSPPGSSAMPTYGAAGPYDDLLQRLRLEEGEDRLWPNYEHVRMVRVEPDASAVVFRVEVPGKPESEWKSQPVFKNELNLPEEYLTELYESRGQPGAKRPPRTSTPQPQQRGAWKPVDVTTVENDRVYISRDDHEFLRDNMSRVVHEQIGVRSYEGRRGLRGVEITRVPPRLARFGVSAGDVVLEVNGVPVRNKSHALKVGKSQYRKGTRAFRVKILSRGVIEERTYYAPEKK